MWKEKVKSTLFDTNSFSHTGNIVGVTKKKGFGMLHHKINKCSIRAIYWLVGYKWNFEVLRRGNRILNSKTSVFMRMSEINVSDLTSSAWRLLHKKYTLYLLKLFPISMISYDCIIALASTLIRLKCEMMQSSHNGMLVKACER